MVGLFPINKQKSKRKFLSPGCVPAFEMAVQAINANNSILSNQKIETFIINTECEPDIVMLEFIKIIKFSTKNKIYNKLVS